MPKRPAPSDLGSSRKITSFFAPGTISKKVKPSITVAKGKSRSVVLDSEDEGEDDDLEMTVSRTEDTSIQEGLDNAVDRVSEYLQKHPSASTLTVEQIRRSFGPFVRFADTFVIASYLLKGLNLPLHDTFVDDMVWLDGTEPFSSHSMARDVVRAEIGNAEGVTFPLSKMGAQQSRALMIFGCEVIPWLIVDALVTSGDVAKGKATGKVTVYSGTGVESKAVSEWIFTRLILARKRELGPFASVTWARDIKFVVLASTGALGLFAGVTVAVALLESWIVEGLSTRQDFVKCTQLAFVQHLEQLLRRGGGDTFDRKTLRNRIIEVIRGEEAFRLFTPEQFLRAPLPEVPTKRECGPWTSTEDELLVDLRKRSVTWKQVHEMMGDHRTLSSLRKRHERLLDQKAEEDGQSRKKVARSRQENVLPLLPLEIDKNVLCPNAYNGCTQRFDTYLLAIYHDDNACKHKQEVGPFFCPSATCDFEADTRNGLATHHRTHKNEDSSFVCRRCSDRRLMTEHLQVVHERRCGIDKRAKGDQRKAQLLELDLGPDDGKPPSIIMVARSSSDQPKNWFQGRLTLEEGLPLWASDKLLTYRKLFKDERRACLVVGWHVKTRFTPRLQTAGFVKVDEESETKADKKRAVDFTNIVHSAIKQANNPVVVSLGADAFFCNIDLIAPFLRDVITFDMVVRFHNLTTKTEQEANNFDLSTLLQCGKRYWGHYSSSALFDRLISDSEEGRKRNKPEHELVRLWNRLQHNKDMRGVYSLPTGRNTT